MLSAKLFAMGEHSGANTPMSAGSQEPLSNLHQSFENFLNNGNDLKTLGLGGIMDYFDQFVRNNLDDIKTTLNEFKSLFFNLNGVGEQGLEMNVAVKGSPDQNPLQAQIQGIFQYSQSKG